MSLRGCWILPLFAWVVLVGGCGSPEQPAKPEAEAVPAAPVVETDPDDPTLLRRPFTAEEIRDAWQPGLMLEVIQRTPQGASAERWTVIAADLDGAEIEYLKIGQDGKPEGESRTGKMTWIELRNHASFPVQNATREEAVRETRLGMLDGWLYTVTDPGAGTVGELFFARSLPGAPVQVRVRKGDDLVMQMDQVTRKSPG